MWNVALVTKWIKQVEVLKLQINEIKNKAK